MNGANSYEGVLSPGDLDVWSFTLCAGEPILLRLDELTVGSPLYLHLRLYGQDGTLLRSIGGASTVELSLLATNRGRFTVMAANDEAQFSGGNGGYRLTANGLSESLRLCDPKISGTNVLLNGVGGASGAEFVVLTSPLVEAPLATWTPLLTNQFDFFGTFSRASAFIGEEPARFYRLQQR